VHLSWQDDDFDLLDDQPRDDVASSQPQSQPSDAGVAQSSDTSPESTVRRRETKKQENNGNVDENA